MLRRHDNQIHIPVQAAIEREVRFLRVNDIVIAVIHRNTEFIPLLQMLRQLHPEGGITAPVFRQHLAVQTYLRGHGCSLYFQKHMTSRFHLRPFQFAHITAASAEIVVAAVLSVHRVPGMWQGHLTALVILIKIPMVIQWNDSSHNNFPFFVWDVNDWIYKLIYFPFRFEMFSFLTKITENL